jgi:hypothetical protein
MKNVMKWPLFFTHWALAFWAVWLTGLTKASPLLALLPCFIVSLLYSLVIKIPIHLALFIIFVHTAPVWVTRRTRFEIRPTIIIGALYMAFLWSQGTNPLEVYMPFITEPPQSFSEFFNRIL